jgi:hypothetical protein
MKFGKDSTKGEMMGSKQFRYEGRRWGRTLRMREEVSRAYEVTDCKHLWFFTLEAGVCSETACRHCGVTLHEIP